MTSEQKATPVILCGKQEEIARRVIEGLKPEFEVVRYICTPDACIAEIPSILNGHTPANPSSILGTGNLGDRPVAIILGGGYNEAFDMVYDSIERTFAQSGSGVAWLRSDMSGPGSDTMGNSYGVAVAQRIKGVLTDLRDEGKLGSGVHWY